MFLYYYLGEWLLWGVFFGKDAGYWMLDTGYWILDTGCWMLDAGCWILDTGCWMTGGLGDWGAG
ncbi:MAG: hypothetical protein K8R63_13955 [Bacteroidales bacterium]|nr:hypothetical protein [Bacteroidales bacterium]